MTDFLNSNGLVQGNIPAGTPCPFHSEYKLVKDSCPVDGKVKSNSFSCGAARAFSLVQISGNKGRALNNWVNNTCRKE